MTTCTLTEETPSSGVNAHEHKWQKAGEHDKQNDIYVCACEGCNKSKLVTKPKLDESKHEKPLLLG